MSLVSGIVSFFEGRVKLFADSKNKDELISFFINKGTPKRLVFRHEKISILTTNSGKKTPSFYFQAFPRRSERPQSC